MAKTIIRIKKKDLEKLFNSHLSSSKESVKPEKEKEDETPEESIDELSTGLNKKIKLFLAKDEIAFLQDVIDNIECETPKEKSMVNNIKHGLTDCLINN